MRVVVDTNVIVSGVLNPFGRPAAILSLILNRELEAAVDARILSEYRDVLKRPQFSLSSGSVDTLVDFISVTGFHAVAAPLEHPLPDADDAMFLEAAFASGAKVLITGNKKHFPQKLCGGVRVVNPQEFLEKYRGKGER